MSQYFELPLYVATSTLNVALFCQHNFVYLVACAITYVMKSVCVYDTIITL
jgi:hypothetical protein